MGNFDEHFWGISVSGVTSTERVSVASDGSESHGIYEGSRQGTISGDGRYVAFTSDAPDLVPHDRNGWTRDVFVHDRVTGTTTLVSVAGDGTQGNANSWMASISGDGRYVAFESDASNLVPYDTNDQTDIFVHDSLSGVTTRVSVASDGTQAIPRGGVGPPGISADGRYVAFTSGASNLVPGDTNGAADIFVHDLVTGVTERVSVASDGGQADRGGAYPSLSADGRFVAFGSLSSDLVPPDRNPSVDVFVHDRLTGETSLASVSSEGAQANGVTAVGTLSPSQSISADGRYVIMLSYATNLAPLSTGALFLPDIYVHDRENGQTWRASVSSAGTPAPGLTCPATISGDGRNVAFCSNSPLLVPGDLNMTWDVFVRSSGMGVCLPALPCVLGG